jgi:hypothetical protein
MDGEIDSRPSRYLLEKTHTRLGCLDSLGCLEKIQLTDTETLKKASGATLCKANIVAAFRERATTASRHICAG